MESKALVYIKKSFPDIKNLDGNLNSLKKRLKLDGMNQF